MEKLANAMYIAFKTLQKPAVAAVLVAVVALLLIHSPNFALAASGGRMGGRSFSRSSRSSTSYSGRSSSGSSRAYSGRSSSGSSRASYSAPKPVSSEGDGESIRDPNDDVVVGIFLFFFLGILGIVAVKLVLSATDITCVLKLQVGLLGLARSLQKDLDRIAESADTSKKEGLSYVLTETCLALLRHPDYCISAHSSVEVKWSMEEGEKRFDQLSNEERGKFDEETLVNMNGIKKKSKTVQKASGFNNEYIVVTILVAAEGLHKLPTINGNSNLKEALQKLVAFPKSKTLAVEVLWTPQRETDTLSKDELLEDYPLLRPL